MIRFDNTEIDFGFELELESEPVGGLSPSASTRARLSLWAVEEATPHMSPGKQFELREGGRIVGRGVIVGSTT
ncbi:MAG: hypothetical protein H0T42_15710 [Deltaproteobacteria bacterium]|nr:hypothetical protein [Deltaproteobacteria bacterium]